RGSPSRLRGRLATIWTARWPEAPDGVASRWRPASTSPTIRSIRSAFRSSRGSVITAHPRRRAKRAQLHDLDPTQGGPQLRCNLLQRVTAEEPELEELSIVGGELAQDPVHALHRLTRRFVLSALHRNVHPQLLNRQTESSGPESGQGGASGGKQVGANSCRARPRAKPRYRLQRYLLRQVLGVSPAANATEDVRIHEFELVQRDLHWRSKRGGGRDQLTRLLRLPMLPAHAPRHLRRRQGRPTGSVWRWPASRKFRRGQSKPAATARSAPTLP